MIKAVLLFFLIHLHSLLSLSTDTMNTQFLLLTLIALMTIAIHPIAAFELLQCQATVKTHYSSLINKDPIGEDPFMTRQLRLTASIVDTEGEEVCSIKDAIKDPKDIVKVPCKYNGASLYLDGPTTRDDLKTMGLQLSQMGETFMLKLDEGVQDFHDDRVYKTVEPFPCNSLRPED